MNVFIFLKNVLFLNAFEREHERERVQFLSERSEH